MLSFPWKKETFNKKTHMDYALFALVVLCVVFGLVMMHSTSSYNGEVKFYFLESTFLSY